MKKVVLLLLTLGFLISCTDSQLGKFTALGVSAHVRCYSGGNLIYEGYSTGKVSSERNSDGYFFIEQKSGKTLEVSGDCIIYYGG